MIKASSRDILRNLKDVNPEVLHLFADTARVLIDQHDGDADRALRVALAYCSGHYKHKLLSKSLLSGQEGFTSLKMTVQRGHLDTRTAYGALRKYWDPRVGDNVRTMKCFRDGAGVAFDVRSDQLEAFMANFERLKETEARVDFDIAKCTDLPDLEDDPAYGNANQNWRDQGQGRNDGY